MNATTEPHILIVDDSRDIRDVISRYLRANGYRTSVAENAAAARRILKTSGIDLAVLDVMMPGEDGLTLCRALRADGALPMIMLTARGEEVDCIVGLEMGADDYMAKPCNPRELLARIAAVLRRAKGAPRAGDLGTQRVKFENWVLDLGRRELTGVNGVALPLSSGEFRLLVAFLERPKMASSREQLLDLTQGRSLEPFDRSVDSAVSRLRRKIEDDARAPRIIKTVYGGGYVFAADPVAA
jgi:two-component system OmpR family response regulator